MKWRLALATLLVFCGAHADAGVGLLSFGYTVAAPSGELAPLNIFNPTGSTVSNQIVTLAQPFGPGDLPNGYHAEIRKSDGSTVVTSQMDGCSRWNQSGAVHNSYKDCTISFVQPDSIGATSNYAYQIYPVSGAPDTTANTTPAYIATDSAFTLKSSDLTRANGTAETGVFDLLDVSYILSNCPEYDPTTGYGTNPVCGWEITGSGPVKLAVHVWMYARRESDGAVHDWLRTEGWVEAFGTTSTPCTPRCTIETITHQPNLYAAIASGTVGTSPETAYVYSAVLANGSNVIDHFGGSSDARVLTLSSSDFDPSTGIITLPGGNWNETTSLDVATGGNGGVFPLRFTVSGGSLPTGITSGAIVWMQAVNDNDHIKIWVNQCTVTNNGCSDGQVTFSDAGSGVITMTPYAFSSFADGWGGLDTSGLKFFVDSTGAVTSAPPIMVGHDKVYLTQKSKAIPPYLTNLTLATLSGPAYTYYPGAYLFPYDMGTTGDGAGDERIDYVNHSAIYSILSPTDTIAAQNARVIAAGFMREHTYHIDETVGLPPVFNNGPNKAGAKYPTFGTDLPSERTYPYNSGATMTPSTADVDRDAIYERYGTWMDSSHLPAPSQGPFLKSGDPLWQFFLEQEANAVIGKQYWTSVQPSSVVYYRVMGGCGGGAGAYCGIDGQTRGVAWGGRILSQADEFEPSTAPMAQYLHDLMFDNGAYYPDFASNVATMKQSSLGYYWGEVYTGTWQFWQDDFVFIDFGVDAWRNEYSGYLTWLTNWFYKQVVTRADSMSAVGGGGCMWAAPSRYEFPFAGSGNPPGAGPWNDTNIPTTWDAFYGNTNANNPSNDGWGPSWGGCPGSDIIGDPGDPGPGEPVSLYTDLSSSLAMASVIGIADASALYAQLRTIQYGYGLSFTDDIVGGGSYPEQAVAPLGATN